MVSAKPRAPLHSGRDSKSISFNASDKYQASDEQLNAGVFNKDRIKNDGIIRQDEFQLAAERRL